MDYFLLKQDNRFTSTPQIINFFQRINSKDLNLLKSDNIPENNSFFVRPSKDNQFIDIIDNPIFLVCEQMRNIMAKYNRNIIFKRAALIDHDNKKQKIYNIPIWEEINALHEDSEIKFNVVKKIVLDKEKVKNRKIFKIKESDKTLVVIRLDVAESLLRREFEGISLERLEIK